MGPIFIVVAINTKRGWLKTICFLLAILGSAAAVLGSREMVLTALIYQCFYWPIWIGIGYAIRFGIRHIKRRIKKD